MQTLVVGVLERADIETPDFLVSGVEPATEESQTESAEDGTLVAEAEPESERTAEEPPATASPISSDEDPNQLADAVSAEDAGPSSAASSPLQALAPAAREATEAEILAATKQYWGQLVQCMTVEAQSRLDGLVEQRELQIYDYLLQRRQGHERAHELLESLDTFAVDPRLLAHGKQVLAWHTSGMKLYDRVLAMLTDASAGQMAGPFAQSWQSASTQLRMEENLVLEKHRAVATYLNHNYNDGAPFVPAFP